MPFLSKDNDDWDFSRLNHTHTKKHVFFFLSQFKGETTLGHHLLIYRKKKKEKNTKQRQLALKYSNSVRHGKT